MINIQIVDKIRPNLTDEINIGDFKARTDAIAEAYRWGSELHAGQTRFSGEPFFETHCVWIANFLEHLFLRKEIHSL